MTRLTNNFRSVFNATSGKSDTIANVLIERVLAGSYSGSREYGVHGESGSDNTIIGQLYLMEADENTYAMQPDVEAFVLKIDHEQRLVDYEAFDNIDAARIYLTANSL